MSTTIINRKWGAVLRLVSYLWIVAMLYLLAHYEPEYQGMIEHAIRLMYLAVGLCLGRNGRLFRSERLIRK